MLVMALHVKVEYTWLEWGHLTRGSTPDCCELVAPTVLGPNIALDGKDVKSGDTEVVECITGIIIICKLHALECAEKLEVSLNRIGGEMQALYIKGLKLVELGKDVNCSVHQLDFCFEYDECTEDGHELGCMK